MLLCAFSERVRSEDTLFLDVVMLMNLRFDDCGPGIED